VKQKSIFLKIRKYTGLIVAIVVVSFTAIMGVGLYVLRENVVSTSTFLGRTAVTEAKHAMLKHIKDYDSIEAEEIITTTFDIEQDINNLTKSIIEAINLVFVTIIIISLIVIGIVIISVYFISKRLAKSITQPIQKLTDGAELISSGKIDHILEVNTGNEMDKLAATFNTMILSLKELSAEKNKAVEEKESLVIFENILNGLDVMIYITDPKTSKILFMNKNMRIHYNITGDCVGELCYEILQKDFTERCSFCPCFKLDIDPYRAIIWEEHSSLTKRIYRNIDRYIRWPNGQMVHMQNSVDMTELIEAKEYAEQSSRYKSAFLATMSHEIRTPMNSILGIAEIQLQNTNLSEEAEEAFEKIHESGDMLLNIINDILDLSKIEAGKMELTVAKYDIPSLINDTAQLNCLRYESKAILFNLQVEENTPLELYGDELRIKQVLNNVLSNAFKYTEEGEIVFTVFSEPADLNSSDNDDEITIVFCISDTGRGMTQDQIDQLFDEYSRFNTEANRTTEGAGLGMNIAKRLIDSMDGSITVESECEKGSVFTVRIPQKKASDDVCGKELIEKLKNFRYQKSSITKKTQFLREYMPYGSVFVVDDVESNIYVIKGMLLPYGLKIDVVRNAFDAIDKIKAGSEYDIIFMDHMMPKMDGMEATKIIRKMGYKHAIVALTANALLGRAEMFLQNGFDGFISKPIDSRELNLLLNEFIKNKKPPEVVEAARQEQREKQNKNIVVQHTNAFEKEAFFIQDAENVLLVLEGFGDKLLELDNKELKSYITAVHGMKSALANIGEKDLSDVALKLEKEGEKNNLKYLSTETPGFINALKGLIEKYRIVDDEEEHIIEISSEDAVYLRERLTQIKTACQSFDKNGAKAALEDLKKKEWPKHINGVIHNIAMHILHSAFKKAAALAENFTSRASPIRGHHQDGW